MKRLVERPHLDVPVLLKKKKLRVFGHGGWEGRRDEQQR